MDLKNLPENFNWLSYLELNSDLVNAGLKTEENAINHYLNFGKIEKRLFEKKIIYPEPKYENSSVFICGTSDEIEILKDSNIVKKIEDSFYVLCINTSFHFFNSISSLFLNGRFKNFTDTDFKNKKIDQIYVSFFMDSKKYEIKNFRIKTDAQNYCSEIKTNLNEILPHGPTTMLDVVFPFCAFNKVKNIYILGAEYSQNLDNYNRHSNDNYYIDRSILTMDKKLELEYAHKKLNVWNDYFNNNGINCFALSERSETPFLKKNLFDLI